MLVTDNTYPRFYQRPDVDAWNIGVFGYQVLSPTDIRVFSSKGEPNEYQPGRRSDHYIKEQDLVADNYARTSREALIAATRRRGLVHAGN